ncbi:MAG: hypothetical protein AAFP86_02965 [Planctomycetota bacterium]
MPRSLPRLSSLPRPRLLLLPPLLALAAASCESGGSEDPGPAPPEPPAVFSAETTDLTPGAVWPLNRAVRLRFSAPVDFASLTGFQVRLEDLTVGGFVDAALRPGLDPATGADLIDVAVLQPACPMPLGTVPGLVPGREYRLSVLGADTTPSPILSAAGEALAETIEIEFRTPDSSDPAVLFHDPVPGPPALVVRGAYGIAVDEPESLRVEVGFSEVRPFELLSAPDGSLEADLRSAEEFPDGLPLNHWIERRHRVAVHFAFDQPIDPGRTNLDRAGLEFFDGTEWRALPGRPELLSICGRRGTTLRFFPEGTLPPGHALRLVLREGFRDLVGEALVAPAAFELPVRPTEAQKPEGARIDALFENFSGAPAMEDTTSDLGAPRAVWGPNVLTGLLEGDGVSRARSRWYAVGRAGLELGAPEEPPAFLFYGTGAEGRVRASGGAVLLEAPAIGPAPPLAVDARDVALDLLDLERPSGFYTELPSMLTRERLRIGPAVAPFPDVDTTIFVVDQPGVEGVIRTALGSGCYFPASFGVDCEPWDLEERFPDPGAARFEVVPQSFEIYQRAARDVIGPDARVTILFDATTEGPDGRPVPAAAYSTFLGWAHDPSVFSGGPWDFVRFEVLFELDVSGDGFALSDQAVSLDFLKIPVDFRR